MVVTIDRLKLLMAPPAEPLYSGSRKEWGAFQKKVGLRFPEDYFTLISTYGSGRFLAGEFKIANPFDPDDEGFADAELARMRETKKDFPDEVPFPLFPESGGLYPFGIDGNGNTYLWITAANPGEWAIVCFNSEDYSEAVRHPLIEFLVLLATNELAIKRRKFWGCDFTEDQMKFMPRKPPAHRGRRSGR